MATVGRPRKDEDSRKSAHLSIRISAKVRAALDEARRQPEGKRSLSQEIELRLLQSFEMDEQIKKRFGGNHTYLHFANSTAERIRSIETSTELAGLTIATRSIKSFP